MYIPDWIRDQNDKRGLERQKWTGMAENGGDEKGVRQPDPSSMDESITSYQQGLALCKREAGTRKLGSFRPGTWNAEPLNEGITYLFHDTFWLTNELEYPMIYV